MNWVMGNICTRAHNQDMRSVAKRNSPTPEGISNHCLSALGLSAHQLCSMYLKPGALHESKSTLGKSLHRTEPQALHLLNGGKSALFTPHIPPRQMF